MNDYNVKEIPIEYNANRKHKSAPERSNLRLLVSPFVSPIYSSEPLNVSARLLSRAGFVWHSIDVYGGHHAVLPGVRNPDGPPRTGKAETDARVGSDHDSGPSRAQIKENKHPYIERQASTIDSRNAPSIKPLLRRSTQAEGRLRFFGRPTQLKLSPARGTKAVSKRTLVLSHSGRQTCKISSN